MNRIRAQAESKLKLKEEKRRKLFFQLIKHEARIERLRKTLKLAEKKFIEQVKYLINQLNEETEAAGDSNNIIIFTGSPQDL